MKRPGDGADPLVWLFIALGIVLAAAAIGAAITFKSAGLL